MIDLNILFTCIMAVILLIIIIGYPRKCKPGTATTIQTISGKPGTDECEYTSELTDNQVKTLCSYSPYNCYSETDENKLINTNFFVNKNSSSCKKVPESNSINCWQENTDDCKDCKQNIRYNDEETLHEIKLNQDVDWTQVPCVNIDGKVCGKDVEGTKKITWEIDTPDAGGRQCNKGVFDGKVEYQSCKLENCPGCCSIPDGAIVPETLKNNCNEASGLTIPNISGEDVCISRTIENNETCIWDSCIASTDIPENQKMPNTCLYYSIGSSGASNTCDSIQNSVDLNLKCTLRQTEDSSGTCVPIKFNENNPNVTFSNKKNCSDISFGKLKDAYNIPRGICNDGVVEGNKQSYQGGPASYDGSTFVTIDYTNDGYLRCNKSSKDECEAEGNDGRCVWVPPPKDEDGNIIQCISDSDILIGGRQTDQLKSEFDKICKNINAHNSVIDASFTSNDGDCINPTGLIVQMDSIPNIDGVPEGMDPDLAWMWTQKDSNGQVTRQIGDLLYGKDGTSNGGGLIALAVGLVNNVLKEEGTKWDKDTLLEFTIGKPILQKHPLNLYPSDESWNNASNIIVNHWSLYFPDFKIIIKNSGLELLDDDHKKMLEELVALFIIDYSIPIDKVDGPRLPISFANINDFKITKSEKNSEDNSIVTSWGTNFSLCDCLNGDSDACDSNFSNVKFQDNGIKFKNVPVNRHNCMVSGQYWNWNTINSENDAMNGFSLPSLNGCVWKPKLDNEQKPLDLFTDPKTTPLDILKLSKTDMQDFSNKAFNCSGNPQFSELRNSDTRDYSGFIQSQTFTSAEPTEQNSVGVAHKNYISDGIYKNLGVNCKTDDSKAKCYSKFYPFIGGTACNDVQDYDTCNKKKDDTTCVWSSVTPEVMPTDISQWIADNCKK